METAQEILRKRIERVNRAIRFEKPDHTPVMFSMDSFAARHKGIKLSDFVTDHELSSQAIFDTIQELGDVDGGFSPFANPLMFTNHLMKVKLPGRDLPEDTLWQLYEVETMTVEDYDTIIEKGWKTVRDDIMNNRLKIDTEEVGKAMAYIPIASKKFENAGYLGRNGGAGLNVTENFSYARSLPKFTKDMYQIPDKVEAALQILHEEAVDMLKQQIKAAKESNLQPPIFAAVSSRGASEFFAPKIWERFYWKYLKDLADTIIENGFVASFHIDSDWTRDLKYFSEFPAHSVIFESDGVTSKEKYLELLGGRQCFKGDVPAQLLALGTPEQVYGYSMKLKSDFGNGLIIGSGCTVPANAKFENVKAMVSAANGK